MERHPVENSGDTQNPLTGYNVGNAPVLGPSTDGNFPVFVPFRFAWVQDNRKLQRNNNGKEPSPDVSKRNLVDKDRHMSSRAYNPTPYCKSKQPFTAVIIQKSASANTVASEPIKRRKDIKEAAVTGRKYRTATPYKRPNFEENTVKKECQVVEELPSSSVTSVKSFPKTRTQHIAATWPNTDMSIKNQSAVGENQAKHASTRFPVPYRKKTTSHTTEKIISPGSSAESKLSDDTLAKDMAVQKSELPTSTGVKRPHEGNKDGVVAKVNQYYGHLMIVIEAIKREQEKAKEVKNETGNEDEKAAEAVIDNGTENRDYHVEESSSDLEDSYTDIEESTDEEIMLEEDNKINIRSIGRCMQLKMKKIVLDVTLTILLCLFLFLKRYFFLTFILIRIFH